MNRTEFLLSLDEMLELAPGTLTGTEVLEELENWDSLAVVNFIALVDEKFGNAVAARSIAASKTVNDLVQLALPASGASAD